jgi:hypothetical protein
MPKDDADMMLFLNMQIIAVNASNIWERKLGSDIAHMYYEFVHIGGGGAYNNANKKKI